MAGLGGELIVIAGQLMAAIGPWSIVMVPVAASTWVTVPVLVIGPATSGVLVSMVMASPDLDASSAAGGEHAAASKAIGTMSVLSMINFPSVWRSGLGKM